MKRWVVTILAMFLTPTFTLVYPKEPAQRLQNLAESWASLIARSDADTARRLTGDPGFRPKSPRLTVLMNPEGTRGFTFSVDQLLDHKALWIPSLRVYLTVGEPGVPFAEHLKHLASRKGRRILDRAQREPEASYEQYKERWEDMGNPGYTNPHQQGPGHVVCLTWDSVIAKSEIDRGAGVWNDLGNPDRFQFWFGLGDIAHLLRDDPKAAIRAFYSYMASAFSHSVFEPVEHRWSQGQFFGPPSTSGAWFELYRHMLIHEMDDQSLLLAQATPRKWLEDGKKIEVKLAPTYFDKVSLTIESRADSGEILASLALHGRRRPRTLILRLRHPGGKPIRTVTVNGLKWKDFDVQREWVRIENPVGEKYTVIASY